MTPVIRISDDVFRRLQTISQPLVDTPNSVISRLLDRHEGSPAPALHIETAPKAAASPTAPTQVATQGLFLAPASNENIRVSLSRAVKLEALVGRLDDRTIRSLQSILGSELSFRCWAMTASSRGTYDNMRVGDVVLFTPKGTGRFSYRATVSGKLESQALGDLLWSVTPGRPWSLVYLLADVRAVDLSKEKLVSEFGYDRGFSVYGIIRVAPERLAVAVQRRGSLDAVLAAADESQPRRNGKPTQPDT